MIKLYEAGVYTNGKKIIEAKDAGKKYDKNEQKKNTIAYSILQKHNTSQDEQNLQIKFDKLTSHDITFVGIIQTALASGLEEFPVPYVLTNCHNSLCAVGGTINEDDHVFGLSAAKKFGGIYVPPHQAVIHQYARETLAKCGDMILGSDSHTRYGALGTMAIGEGGPELVKQLLNRTYDIASPDVIAIYLDGAPVKGVGPQDVALAIIGAVFEKGYVNNKVMEFIGPGVKNLSADFRIGIDVMTTETTCLSSIWQTDDTIKKFYKIHGREEDYTKLSVDGFAYYDGMVYVDLSKIVPMIAMPFHPSNVYSIDEVNAHPDEVFDDVISKAQGSLGENVELKLKDKIRNGKVYIDQGIIAGCAGGGYENICEAADILKGKNIGNEEFTLSVYPASMPIYSRLAKEGVVTDLATSGAVIKTAFCGPCFGAGDTPSNNALSIRHTTRNFPSREGSKPGLGQIASVALMDARSIAATAANKGYLTSACDVDYKVSSHKYFFDSQIYDARVYKGFGKADKSAELIQGPNIKPWPVMPRLADNVLLKVASVITDPVTTTDELIPSGETSSYRSNPLGLAEFTLSRRDPKYVGRAKEIKKSEDAIIEDKSIANLPEDFAKAIESIKSSYNVDANNLEIGSVIYANKPGDGSAREQAASCQRVLGGLANISKSYATKRYRSNLINWGMLPFIIKDDFIPDVDDFIFIPDIKSAIDSDTDIKAYVVNKDMKEITLTLNDLTDAEKEIIKLGCLINYYRESR